MGPPQPHVFSEDQASAYLGLTLAALRHLAQIEVVPSVIETWRMNLRMYVRVVVEEWGTTHGLTSKTPPGSGGRPVPSSPSELVRVLEAAPNRTLVLPNPKESTRRAWRRLFHAANESEQLPAGEHVRHAGRNAGHLVVWLEALPDARQVAPAVPVLQVLPADVHPLLAPLRRRTGQGDEWIATFDDPDVIHLGVSRDHLDRALRIGQSIIDEAIRRGYRVQAGRGLRCKVPGLLIATGTETLEISIIEETEKPPAKNSYTLVPQPSADRRRTGRLVLLNGHSGHDLGNVLGRDGKRWVLESRIGTMFAKIEERAAEHLAGAAREQDVRAAAARVSDLAERSGSAPSVGRDAWLDALLDRRRRAADIRALISDVGDRLRAEDRTWLAALVDEMDPATGPIESAPT